MTIYMYIMFVTLIYYLLLLLSMLVITSNEVKALKLWTVLTLHTGPVYITKSYEPSIVDHL